MATGMEWAIFGLVNFVVVSLVSYYIGRWQGRNEVQK